MGKQPALSVLIPALNEASNIERCINSIKEHTPTQLHFEIIVGDHGSTDNTTALALRCGAKVISVHGGTVGYLRNQLASIAHGTILIFLDADTTVTAEWGHHLNGVVNTLAVEPYQVTGSLCLPPESTNPFIKYWFSKLPRGESGYLGTGHMITTSALFHKINGFDPTLRSGEDYDFCERAKTIGNATIAVKPELKVIHHDYPMSARSFIRREIWHGAGDFQSLRRVMQSKVAIATLMFVLLHMLLIASVILAPHLSLFFILTVLGLISVCSVLKFPSLGLHARIVNILICYLYFFGRVMSAIYKVGSSKRR